MKVLVVTEPGVDGVFRYVESLCHFLWEQRVEVHLGYSDRRGSDRLLTLVEEVQARGGRTLNLRTANRPEPADGTAFRGLWKLAREVRPDVIHSHSSKAGFLARMLRFAGINAVQCYHPHAYVGMRPHQGRFDGVYNGIEAVLGRLSHTVVVSSDETAFARDRLKIPVSRLHLIPNGVDLEMFSPVSPEEKRRMRARLGVPADAVVLGCIGRSSEQKDPLTLYRAFAQAAAERPIMLLHVGRGELDVQLDRIVAEHGLADRVVRVPYTAEPATFYRVIDGFVLTSRYEGFSIAALEALAANLPLVLSNGPGNRDLLAQPLSHAWGAPVGDTAAFARNIVAWYDRIQTTNTASDTINHRQIAHERFELRDRYGAVLRLYRELLQARGPGRPAAIETEEERLAAESAAAFSENATRVPRSR